MYKLCKKGGKYIEVDAAYTSQQCHSCGHIDKKNRMSQADFLCISCGHADNADINAAKNIYDKGVVGPWNRHLTPIQKYQFIQTKTLP